MSEELRILFVMLGILGIAGLSVLMTVFIYQFKVIPDTYSNGYWNGHDAASGVSQPLGRMKPWPEPKPLDR